LADRKGRFLFEIRPDVFPEGYLTDAEVGLWRRWFEAHSKN